MALRGGKALQELLTGEVSRGLNNTSRLGCQASFAGNSNANISADSASPAFATVLSSHDRKSTLRYSGMR